MAEITPEEARAFLRRWQLARDAEIAELRRTSTEMKGRQLAALMASRDVFGAEPDREAQVSDVRERWARLRLALRG